MNSQATRTSAVAAAIALACGGCSHAGDAGPAPQLAYLQTLPGSFADPEGHDAPFTGPTAGEEARWWQLAGDPALDSLLEQAAGANTDILAAAARLAQAQAIAQGAGAARLPRLDGSIGVTRNETFGGEAAAGSTSIGPQVELGWDPDLFGRLRKDAAAARADLAAAGYDADNLHRQVRLEVIRAYVGYREVEARLGYVALSIERQQDILDLVEKRYALGLSVETDRQQARLQMLQVQALEPQLRNERNRLRNRLAVLTGVSSSALDPQLDTAGDVPLFPVPAAIGVPADVVRLRPDVRAAESRLLAAGERIGAARAALLPQLSINATLSTVAASPAGLFDTILGQMAGRIAQSLFAGGAQKAAVARSRAAADEALALYRATVLGALESCENALSAARTTQMRLAINGDAVEAAEQAARQAPLQNELGLIDFYVVLGAEQSLLSQREELAATRAAHAVAVAELHVALGETALQGAEASAPAG